MEKLSTLMHGDAVFLATQDEKAKKEVIKHSAAVQISNKLTVLQWTTWTALLFHAYNELPNQEEHSITIKSLINLINYNSNNIEYLKGSSLELMRNIVQWNVLHKDNSLEWGATTMLSQIKIKDGICTYAFSPELRRRLYNPSMYVKIDLALQNRFNSKHALSIWELCLDYLGSEREKGETPFISLEKLKELMGVGNSYPKFMNFNQKVIKPAISEVNRLSDFRVEVEYLRQSRKVVALKFKMHRIKPLPAALNKQGDLFPDLKDIPLAVKLLKEAGLSSNDAWDVWQKGVDYIETDDKPAPEAFESYLQEKIDLLKHRQQTGKVESATGFLLSAIRYNYAPGKTAKTVSKRRQAKRTQAQAERQAELRERFAEHREQVFWRRFEERPEAWRAEQRQRFEAMLQGDPTHRFVWQSYREHGSLQSPSITGVFIQMLADELLIQPEETSLEAFAAWVDKAA